MSKLDEWKAKIDKLSQDKIENVYTNLSLFEEDYSKKVSYLQNRLWNGYVGTIQDKHRKNGGR